MLDRNDTRQFHYYQPGFGTYTTSIWMSRGTADNSIKKWYFNAKDAALGTAFDEHVMDGYRFLMRFYCPGDRIYIFGFSRGAYVARLLAEMLDHVGILEAGNEGKVRYIWSVFAKWGQRSNRVDTDQKEKDEIYQYMKALRETFCLPVSQIRFLGLFDTVNSIPRFEVSRDKFRFPFTAKTSAKVIRHAVGIDERRAKFREDLMSDSNSISLSVRERLRDRLGRYLRLPHRQESHSDQSPRIEGHRSTTSESPGPGISTEETFYRPVSRSRRQAVSIGDQRMHTEFRNEVSLQHPAADSTVPATTSTTVTDQSLVRPRSPYESEGCPSEESEDTTQDIEEIWFPGCHADIGGGFKLSEDEDFALSHVPLVWMVHEAQRAGLRFDPTKLKQFHCFDDSTNDNDLRRYPQQNNVNQESEANGEETKERSKFKYALWRASTNGQIHDFLRYGHGVPWPTVLSWQLVEYLPFRRMNMQNDGSWKPIRWPLPLGERRDIPKQATIHGSAIRRMEVNPEYRPKNLIRGGKGKKKIPEVHGIRDWEVHADWGCPVRETYRRKQPNKPK